MSNDDKTTTTKPEQAPSERHWLENLGRLDLAHKPERLAIMAALLRHIGSQARELEVLRGQACEAPEEGGDPNRRLGGQVGTAMDYTIARIAQLPGLEPGPAAVCAALLSNAAQAWGNLGLLLDMTAERTIECNAIRTLAQECQQAYDGWRVQQPATEEPNAEERLALSFIPPDGEHGEPGK